MEEIANPQILYQMNVFCIFYCRTRLECIRGTLRASFSQIFSSRAEKTHTGSSLFGFLVCLSSQRRTRL